MWKSASVLAVAFTLSQSVSAALIDNGTYLTDSTTGLDWLKLTETTNRSYNDVSAQLGIGGQFAGWQYASGAQFESLLLGQGAVPDVGCSDGTNFCGGPNSANYSIISNLVNTLGDTFEQAKNGGVLTSSSVASLGILSDSNLGSHYVGLMVGSSISDTPYAATHYSLLDNNDNESHIGSFLIRPSVVPVPASGYLFISALIGVFGRLRQSRAN